MTTKGHPMTPTPADDVALPLKPMTASRAQYFMERFRKEEKLLGPNEQAAVAFVIALLEREQDEAAIAADRAKRAGLNSEGLMRAYVKHTSFVGTRFESTDWAGMLNEITATPPAPTQTQPAQTQENKG